MWVIKIVHSDMNPQNINQSYKWKLKFPPVLLTFPSLWTVNVRQSVRESRCGGHLWYLFLNIPQGHVECKSLAVRNKGWQVTVKGKRKWINWRRDTGGINKALPEEVCSEGDPVSIPAALPMQSTSSITHESWAASLKTSSGLDSAHSSVFGRTVFPGTAVLLPPLTALPLQALLVVLWTASSTASCTCLRLEIHLPPPLSPPLVLMGYFSPHISLLSAFLSSRAGPVLSSYLFMQESRWQGEWISHSLGVC